jgi:hypothetical protein
VKVYPVYFLKPTLEEKQSLLEVFRLATALLRGEHSSTWELVGYMESPLDSSQLQDLVRKFRDFRAGYQEYLMESSCEEDTPARAVRVAALQACEEAIAFLEGAELLMEGLYRKRPGIPDKPGLYWLWGENKGGSPDIGLFRAELAPPPGEPQQVGELSPGEGDLIEAAREWVEKWTLHWTRIDIPGALTTPHPPSNVIGWAPGGLE